MTTILNKFDDFLAYFCSIIEEDYQNVVHYFYKTPEIENDINR